MYFTKFDNDLNNELNNIDKMKAIENWQESDMHPLTCNDCDRRLYEDLDSKEVVLKCPCGYIQKDVPKVVYDRYRRLINNISD